jgi:hypothetical protein
MGCEAEKEIWMTGSMSEPYQLDPGEFVPETPELFRERLAAAQRQAPATPEGSHSGPVPECED